MCRNIKCLHHFEPPASAAEIEASALQYVRKLSGMAKPSVANAAVFARAVAQITRSTKQLFENLDVSGPPRTRENEALKAKARGVKREEAMRKRYGS
jgi:hypothetical protein